MILLDTHNYLIQEILRNRIEAILKNEPVTQISTKIVDFDGTFYQVTADAKKFVQVSMKMRCFTELSEHNINEILTRIYGDMLVKSVEDFNVTLLFDVEKNVKPDSTIESFEPIIRNISSLKRNCFGALYERFFTYPCGKTATIHFREEEVIYIEKGADRVIVIFSTIFKYADDGVVGRVFLEIFPERRQKYQQSPQVIVSYRNPPKELKSSNVLTDKNMGYITFVLFSHHTDPKVRENTIDLLHMFRSHLHYHIKCSKTYTHARMRRKTAEFLRRLDTVKNTSAKPNRFSDQVSKQAHNASNVE